MRVGVIGLGNIGSAVAANLVADGHDVFVNDADEQRAVAIKGVSVVDSADEVGANTEVTLLSLPTPEIVESVAQSWAQQAPADSILVDLSTNDPASVRSLGETLAASGHHLVEAPLTGGAPGATNRMLVFMVGGENDPVQRVMPLLETLGRASFHLGPLGSGNTMKLVNSLVAYAATWSSLEALSVSTKAGIDLPAAVEVIRTAGAGNFWIDRMAESIDVREGPTQFALAHAAKDARLIVETGRSLGVPTPVGSAISGVLANAVEDGFGIRDWRALVEVAEIAGNVELHWERE